MKKIKILVVFLILLVTSSAMYGQQDPHYTQYMYNMAVINPAYVGSRGVTAVTLLARTQWVGLDGSPSTGTFSVSSPIGNEMGVGISVIHDQIGPAKETNLYADYSYTLNLSGEGRLAFGLKAGVSFLDVSFLDFQNPNDPLNVPVSQTSPNFGLGAYYYTDTYYLGFSAPNFLSTKHLETDNGFVSTASEEMHFFLTAGYVFDIAEDVKLKPSTMMRGAQGSPLSVDLSLNLLYNEKFEAGLSYRFNEAVIAMLGFQATDDLRLGFAYDQTINNFGTYNSGSYELIISYEFEKRSCKCPRYF